MGVVSVGASLWILAGLQSPRTVQIIISCLGLIIVAKYNTGEISSSWYFKYFGSQHLWQGQNPNLSVIQVDRNTDTHWLNQTMNNAEIIFKYLNVSQSLLLIILATWILRWSWRPVTSWLILQKVDNQHHPSDYSSQWHNRCEKVCATATLLILRVSPTGFRVFDGEKREFLLLCSGPDLVSV